MLLVFVPKQRNNDSLWWILVENGKFTVKALKEFIDENIVKGQTIYISEQTGPKEDQHLHVEVSSRKSVG